MSHSRVEVSFRKYREQRFGSFLTQGGGAQGQLGGEGCALPIVGGWEGRGGAGTRLI